MRQQWPEGPNGLAMCSSGPQGQTEERSDEGPSEQRAVQRSACRRQEAPNKKAEVNTCYLAEALLNLGLVFGA